MQVTFKGDPVELKGTPPKVGDKAPDATLIARNKEEVKLSNFEGNKPVILSVIPDVLTRTCELQTKSFADKVDENKYVLLTVSRNTVDEFNKWNEENELNLVTLSDDKGEFGDAYGLEIDLDGDERLARSVFVVDPDATVRYVQIVDEIADEPNYDEVLAVLDTL